MKLKEYKGKELFKKYGIKVPNGKLISKVENIKGIAKAQVLSGKRKKSGLIKESTKENLRELFKQCDEVLVEEKLNIEKEYYLSLTIDRNEKGVVILFSEEGGIDIEENKNILKLSYRELDKFPKKEFLDIIKKMHKLMKGENALLVEINPLALVKNELIALDSKIILDDNSYSEVKEIAYVELDGNIAIIGNGAGLVMATLDTINYFGGKAANFLDLGGGADKERMKEAINLILKKNPKSIFINIFGGITRCDEIAQGIVELKINIPMVVRMIGTNDKEARKILEKNKIKSYDSMEECAKMAVEYAR